MKRHSAGYCEPNADQDKQSNRRAIVDTTHCAHTTFFDLQSITRPLIGLTRLAQHDGAGFPGELTDVNGQVQRFTYDGRGRLTEVFYPADGSTRSTLYNQAGLVESTLDEDQVSAEYTYEPVYGRLAIEGKATRSNRGRHRVQPAHLT
jgi:YD repeat-containing protein